jgi:hypothetical protein
MVDDEALVLALDLLGFFFHRNKRPGSPDLCSRMYLRSARTEAELIILVGHEAKQPVGQPKRIFDYNCWDVPCPIGTGFCWMDKQKKVLVSVVLHESCSHNHTITFSSLPWFCLIHKLVTTKRTAPWCFSAHIFKCKKIGKTVLKKWCMFVQGIMVVVTEW